MPSSNRVFGALPLPVISATYLTGATLPLLLTRAQLEAVVTAATQQLPPHRRPVLRPDLKGNARHPLVIDVWQLQQGRLEFGGLTQHEWTELGYGAVGGALNGALLGLGAVLDATTRERERGAVSSTAIVSAALRAGFDGLASGATAFRRIGRALSENGAHHLGNYAEVMFSIPNVGVAHDPRAFSLSLGVYTDSNPACAIDRFFRYGLGKTLAAIHLGRSERSQLLRVIDRKGREVLGASLREGEPLAALPDELASWMNEPLLGLDSSRTDPALRWSCLRRHFDAAGLRQVEGELTLPLAPFGLPSGKWRLSSQSVIYERIWSEITVPATLPDG